MKAVLEWTAKLPEAATDIDNDLSPGEASKRRDGPDGLELESREEIKPGSEADFGKAKAHKSSLEAAVAEVWFQIDSRVITIYPSKQACFLVVIYHLLKCIHHHASCAMM